MRQNPAPTVSRNSRSYETNDVSAAEEPVAFSASALFPDVFIAMPQHQNTSEYWDTIEQIFEHLLWHSLIPPMI
jgi:hypothetical protein